MVEFLKPIASYFDTLERSNIPAFDMVIPVYYSIQRSLVANLEADDSDPIEKLKATFSKSLESTFLPEITLDHYIATFLNPKFKSFKFLQKSERNFKLAEVKQKIMKISEPPQDEIVPKAKKEKTNQMFDFDSSSDEGEVEANTNSELTQYIDSNSQDEPIDFWKKNANRLPSLTKLFMHYDTFNPSESLSERIFSISGQFNTKTRSSLSVKKLSALTVVKSAMINGII